LTGDTPTHSRSTSVPSGEPRAIQPRADTSAAMLRCASPTPKHAWMLRDARSPMTLSSCHRWRRRSAPSRTVSGLSGRFSPMHSPNCGTCLSRPHQTKSRRLSGPGEVTSGRPTPPRLARTRRVNQYVPRWAHRGRDAYFRRSTTGWCDTSRCCSTAEGLAEPPTLCFSGAIQQSRNVAGRGRICHLAAWTVAHDGSTSPTACLRWLPLWPPVAVIRTVSGLHESGSATHSLSVLRFRPEARRNPGLVASCLMSIRYSPRRVRRGRHQRLSFLAASFDLTWLTCLTFRDRH